VEIKSDLLVEGVVNIGALRVSDDATPRLSSIVLPVHGATKVSPRHRASGN